MTTWRVIELAKAGYADHKPPYDFKHGWVPVSGAAKKAVPDTSSGGGKKVSKPEDVTDEIKAKLPPMLKQKTWKHNTDQDWLNAVNDYMDRHPEGFGATSKPEPPEVPKKAPQKPAVRKRKTAAKPATMPESTSQTQRDELNNPGPDRTDEFTKEWSSAASLSQPLDQDESEAVHQWQNGYTEAFFDEDSEDEDASPETGLYQVLNDMKRGTGQYDLGMLDEDDLNNLELMDQRIGSALAKSKLNRDVTLFRGVADMQDVEVGDVLTDEGYQATTLNPSTASSFLGGGQLGAGPGARSKVLVITARKGSHALPVREREAHERVFGIKHEMVLGPGSLKVTGKSGSYVFVEVQ